MRNLIAGLVIVTLLFFAETGYSVDLNKEEMARLPAIIQSIASFAMAPIVKVTPMTMPLLCDPNR